MDIKTIRKAVISNRGGWEQASDEQILTLWNGLDEDTQQKYLSDIEPKGKNHADTDRPGKQKPEISNSPGRR